MPDHARVYSHCELYDVAFSFKDVPAECSFLAEVFQRFAGRPVTSFLELCAGPGTNAIEMARRGYRAHALDLSAEMVEYGSKLAARAGVELDYRRGDITAFMLESPVDCIAILMDSTSYLLDNDAVLRNFDCVADALVAGGIYVLEMTHPRYVFASGKPMGTDWKMERDGLEVFFSWSAEGDQFDPITQITQTTVEVSWKRGEERGELTEVAPQRCFTSNEIRALVAAAGRFEWVGEFGALDVGIPFSNEEESWRMVPVLRKR